MEKERKINDFTKEEYFSFIKRQREIFAIEECENLEQILTDRVKKVLDLIDLMKIAKNNYKRSKKVINKFIKSLKKEKDIKKLLKKQDDELYIIESKYVASMIDLMMIIIKSFGSDLFKSKLNSLEKWYEFELEDFILVNGIIKSLMNYKSSNLSILDVMNALDNAIKEYITCIDNNVEYRDLFDKSFMFVCFPEKEEQEGEDE